MSEYVSGLAPLMDEFESYRTASRRWSEGYRHQLALFDRHCAANHPGRGEVTREMPGGWCAKRDSESNNSCRARTSPVVAFVRFLQKRGLTAVAVPAVPRKEPTTSVPHAFTHGELQAFFNECDAIAGRKSAGEALRRITIPVFFRLLYSSGIRMCEARMLRKADVDLAGGVLNIEKSKGYAQHFVVLHDSMLELMREYDAAVGKMCPDREYFFPARDGGCNSQQWVLWNFRKLWSQCSDSAAVPYAFRHNYAIENINRWTGDGFGFDAKLLCPGKSMGHASVESTKYYYSLVPRLADTLARLVDEDDTIPEVPDAGNQ